MTGATASVGNVESSIKARESVGEDDDELNAIVEDIEAGLVVVPGWVGDGTDLVSDSGAESGTDGEERGCEGKKSDFGAHTSLAELIHRGFPGEKHAEGNDGQW